MKAMNEEEAKKAYWRLPGHVRAQVEQQETQRAKRYWSAFKAGKPTEDIPGPGFYRVEALKRAGLLR